MPYIPSYQKLIATTPNILNAIRNEIGGQYKDLVPLAKNTNESIQAIGKVLMSYPSMQNSFVEALTNKVGMTIFANKSYYENPWKMFKRGMLEFGEAIEEIFVQMAKPFKFDPDDAEDTIYKQNKPELYSAFHRLNSALHYDTTIREDELKLAFLSMSGVTNLVTQFMTSLYDAMEYDEFQVMKYMLGRTILDGKVKATTISAVSTANLAAIMTTIKEASGNFTYKRADYNMAGVTTHSPKEDQYFIPTTGFESGIDVSLLANAFNMDKVDYLGHRVGVDSFGMLDANRLALIFADDPTYVPMTEDEIAQLKLIPAVLIDKDFFMIFDNKLDLKNVENGKGLYWNYWLHVWKTYSISPFANATVFIATAQGITSVTVTPATVTALLGSTIALGVNVVATGFASEEVIWTTDSTCENTVVTPNGILSVGADEDAETITVTATSVVDGTKTDTCVVTVFENITP